LNIPGYPKSTPKLSEFFENILSELYLFLNARLIEIDQKSVFTDEGVCCLGECKNREIENSGSTTRTIIAVLIILVIFGLLFYIWKKYRKKGKSAAEVMKEIEDKYKKQPSKPAATSQPTSQDKK